MSNFLFLKKENNDLYKIITEAEKLFRDEYFEQATIQTRKFAENLCKDLLGDKISKEDNFDNIINKLKDNSFENVRMQEFVKDLYFIKKNGNTSAHSVNSSNIGEIALECLECAFEISIFYSHIKFGYDEKLDKTLFSEELLMTGKKSKETLKEKYVKTLNNERNKQERVINTVKQTQIKKKNKSLKTNKIKTTNTYTKNVKTLKTNDFNVVKIIFIVLILITLIIAGLFIYKSGLE